MSVIEKFVLENLDKSLDWACLSSKPFITWEIITTHSQIPWDYNELSKNPSITWENIDSHLNKSWNWDELSCHPNITWDIVNANRGGHSPTPLTPLRNFWLARIMDQLRYIIVNLKIM
jgi:hypothetical protein